METSFLLFLLLVFALALSAFYVAREWQDIRKTILRSEMAKERLICKAVWKKIAKTLCVATEGKVRIEDAGFNWKVFGRDVGEVDFVAFTCDQDAHANTGQKCSATSLLVLHENWMTSPNNSRFSSSTEEEKKQCPGSTGTYLSQGPSSLIT